MCEAVKVYLDVPGLVFVIGCDRSALGPSGMLRDLGPAGSAFMEKVFQTSYRLPVAGGGDVEAYVRHCAERSGLRELLDDDTVKLIADRSVRDPRRIKRLINGFGLESENGATAGRILGTHGIDLLISDVARGAERDAGFTDLAQWRERGHLDGPAVFFAGRVTPARERRCRELGAYIAGNGTALFEYIDAACAEIRQRRS